MPRAVGGVWVEWGKLSRSGWAGARRPSEYKRPETYLADKEAVPVELRWPGRVLWALNFELGHRT